MEFIGIIPARYGSTRFPGKPLVNINGKIMIQRVYEQACKVLDNVFVATDDDRIISAVENFNGRVILTAKIHKSGTDRCAEAINNIHKLTKTRFDVIINIQGDEPYIHPKQISELTGCFDNNEIQISTLIKKIENNEDIFNPNYPKVIINENEEAIYFSRSPIPYIRNYDKENWIDKHVFFKHIGIYAYKYSILKEITRLKQSSLEISESLEQNRWIENGYRIKAKETRYENISVDTPEDLEKLKNIKAK